MRVQPTNVGEQSEFSPRENWRGAAKKSHAPASDSAVTASPEAFFGGAADPALERRRTERTLVKRWSFVRNCERPKDSLQCPKIPAFSGVLAVRRT